LDQLGDILSRLEAVVDFATLAKSVDKAAPRSSRKKGGRPPFPTEMMVRILIIQQLHNLSDEQAEYQLLDRLSFQRFVGLRHSSAIPDRTTIWNFRERLVQADAHDLLFTEFNRQIEAAGFVARQGQMVDATLVEAPIQHFTKQEKEVIDRGDIPEEWSEAKRRQKDLDASWTKKHGRWSFGTKLSANVDRRYKMIRAVKVSTASEHDTLHLEDVLDPDNTSKEIYADKGYVDRAREQKLIGAGWRPHIQR